MTSVQKNAIAELGTEFIGADGRKTILLEPEKWLGKELPLMNHTDIGKHLDRGIWLVLLHDHTCSSCRKSVRLYQELAIGFANIERAPRIVMLELPPYDIDKTLKKTDDPVVYGKLDKSSRWKIGSPTLLLVDDRRVLNVFENPLDTQLIRAIWGCEK